MKATTLGELFRSLNSQVQKQPLRGLTDEFVLQQVILDHRLSKKSETFCMAFTFLVYYIALGFSSIHLHFFDFLVLREDTVNFLQNKAILDQTSIFLSTMIWIVVVILGIVFKSQTIQKRLSFVEFKVLYWVLLYSPPFLSLLVGVCCGLLTATNSFKKYAVMGVQEIQITLLLGFSVFIGIHLFFKTCARYDLWVSSGALAHWEFPFEFADYLVIFLCGMAIGFSCDNDHTNNIVISSSLFIISIATILMNQRPLFTSFFGNVLIVSNRAGLFLFSIYGVITSIVKMSFLVELLIFILLSFSTLTIAFFVCLQRQTMTGFLHSTSHQINIASIRSKNSAISTVRYSIMQGNKGIIGIPILQWLLNNYCSLLLIRDITRLCMTAGINLEDLTIPPLNLNRFEFIALKFLSLQVCVVHHLDGKDLPEMSGIINMMRIEIENTKQKILGYWSTEDHEKSDLLELGHKIQCVTQKLTLTMMEYGSNPEITKLWQKYADEVLMDRSQHHILFDPIFQYTVHDDFSLFGPYSSRKTVIKNHHLLPNQDYFSKQRKSYLSPYFIGTFFCFAIIFFTYFIYSIVFIINSDKFWIFFKQVSEASFLLDTYSRFAFSLTERSITLPTPQIISKVLNIDIEKAGEFRTYRIPSVQNETIERIRKSLYSIPLFWLNSTVEGCGTSGMTMLLQAIAKGSPNSPDLRSAVCYQKVVQSYVRLFRDLNIDLINENTQISTTMKCSNRWSNITTIIYTIIFLIILFREGYYRRRALHTLSEIAVLKSHQNYFHKPNVIHYLSFSFLLWLVLIGIIHIFYYIYRMLQSTYLLTIIKVASQVFNTAEISSSAQLLVSLSNLQINGFNEKEAKKLVKEQYSIFVQALSNLTENKIHSTFSNIYVLSHLTGFGENSQSLKFLDFAHLMSITNITVDSYSYLKGRQIYFANLAILTKETVQEMSDHVFGITEALGNLFYRGAYVFFIIIFCIYLFFYMRYKSLQTIYDVFSIICQNEIHQNQELIHTIRYLLDDSPPNYIEEIPYPLLVTKDTDNRMQIAKVNSRMLEYLRMTYDQVVCQTPPDEFVLNPRIVKMKDRQCASNLFSNNEYDATKGYTLHIFRNITSYYLTDQVSEKLVNNFRLNQQFPNEMRIKYIVVVFIDPIDIDDFKEFESKYPEITKVYLSSSFYYSFTSPETTILPFIETLYSRYNSIVVSSIGNAKLCYYDTQNHCIPYLVGDFIEQANVLCLSDQNPRLINLTKGQIA